MEKVDEKIEYSIVPIKMADLASFIAAKKRMSVSDAICYLYNSEFVTKLYDEKSKWWYLDNETLYDLIEQERRSGSMDFSTQKVQFVIFCIESYARKHHLSGLEVFALFRKKGALAFLQNHFEVLHTQGEAYILEEVELFLKNRKRK